MVKESLETYKSHLDKTVTDQISKFQKEKEKYINTGEAINYEDQRGIDHDLITAVESGT